MSKSRNGPSYGLPSVTSRPPIFILGVPRSGTTLLRTILDGHSAIAAGPETPWLGGHQPRSLMALWGALRNEPWGYCKSFGMPDAVATEAARAFMTVLMDRYCQHKHKSRWAEKTPDNALYVPFLLELFPEAKFIHLTRDGLDTAMSTSVIAPHRKGISAFLEKNLGFGPGVPPVDNTPFAAILRWRHWNNLIRTGLSGHEHHEISYEHLVTEPASTIRALMDFIGEPFEPAMLDYAKSKHDFPSWEWGSADVMARGTIGAESVGRGKRELMPDQLRHLSPMVHASSSPEPLPAPEVLGYWIHAFAAPMGLEPPEPQDFAAISWLWHHGLAESQGLRVVGSPSHALPWICALLGAKLCFQTPPDAKLLRLATALKIDIAGSQDQPVLLLKGLPGDDDPPIRGGFVLGHVGHTAKHRVTASFPGASGGLGASILAPA